MAKKKGIQLNGDSTKRVHESSLTGKSTTKTGTTPGGRKYLSTRGVNESGGKYTRTVIDSPNGHRYTKSKGESPRTVHSNPDKTFKIHFRGNKKTYIKKGPTKSLKK